MMQRLARGTSGHHLYTGGSEEGWLSRTQGLDQQAGAGAKSRPTATHAARGGRRGRMVTWSLPELLPSSHPLALPTGQTARGGEEVSPGRAQGKRWIHTHQTLAGAAPLRAVTDGYSGPQMVSGVGVIARLTGGIRDLNLVLIYVSFIEGGGAAAHVKHRFHSHVHGLRLGGGRGGLEEGEGRPRRAIHFICHRWSTQEVQSDGLPN